MCACIPIHCNIILVLWISYHTLDIVTRIFFWVSLGILFAGGFFSPEINAIDMTFDLATGARGGQSARTISEDNAQAIAKRFNDIAKSKNIYGGFHANDSRNFPGLMVETTAALWVLPWLALEGSAGYYGRDMAVSSVTSSYYTDYVEAVATRRDIPLTLGLLFSRQLSDRLYIISGIAYLRDYIDFSFEYSDPYRYIGNSSSSERYEVSGLQGLLRLMVYTVGPAGIYIEGSYFFTNEKVRFSTDFTESVLSPNVLVMKAGVTFFPGK